MAHATARLQGGHRIELLEGSHAFFPALIAAMDAARREIHFETYIFDFTGSSTAVAEALVRAAERGVRTCVAVDGLGTGRAPPSWAKRFAEAGVTWRIYSPVNALVLLLPTRWRRLHRKLCVVDGHTAFCGGINVLDDYHDPSWGALQAPRLDFAVRVTGPLVADAHRTVGQLWRRLQAVHDLRRHDLPSAMRDLIDDAEGQAATGTHNASRPPLTRATLLLRDNLRHRKRIEQAYLKAIGAARHEIVIANAYFIPGRKLRNALVQAARRGVRVRLLLQGRYEYFLQYHASRPVYGMLLDAGVEIHEYAPSFLHAKVAVVDGHWATVGSSNLDPLSLLLAREANVVIEDAPFAQQLAQRLDLAMRDGGQRMEMARYDERPLLQRCKERLAMAVMRLGLFVTGNRY
ncbi:cardiolipin synthase ClsB [Pseudorhodoferax sp. Leaf267]|uniref:cardiolipin synthase ClsB n=1 Tax=Pseudorhodoferax sp. Leaf267 TaxID=1736316 RepID=UPI0006FB9A2F|nr:cardiolipin synthase ClsB [Pseudorhodoferax sp. Leaf267]KQP18224.1 phospholipase [Pseudorhodoferax sp. Leaf267]